MKSKKQYIAPELKVEMYKVEAGFAISISNYLEQFENGQESWAWDSEDETQNHFGENDWSWQ